tara:strand:- start:707 stop:1006 length:300 start_codon:yes stop_codon:yes gene_type:complete
MDEDRDIDKKPDVENVEDKEIEEEAKEEEEEEEEPPQEEEVEQVRVQVSIPRFSNTRNLDVLDSVRGYSRHGGLPTSSRDLHSVRLVELPHPGVSVDFI